MRLADTPTAQPATPRRKKSVLRLIIGATPLLLLFSGLGSLAALHGPVYCNSTDTELCVVEHSKIPGLRESSWTVVNPGEHQLVTPMIDHVHHFEMATMTVPLDFTVLTRDGLPLNLKHGSYQLSVRAVDAANALKTFGPKSSRRLSFGRQLTQIEYGRTFSKLSLDEVIDKAALDLALSDTLNTVRHAFAQAHIDVIKVTTPRIDLGVEAEKLAVRIQAAKERLKTAKARHADMLLLSKKRAKTLQTKRQEDLKRLDEQYEPELNAAREAQHETRLRSNLSYQKRLAAAKTARDTAAIRVDAERYSLRTAAAALAQQVTAHRTASKPYLEKLIVDYLFPQLSLDKTIVDAVMNEDSP